MTNKKYTFGELTSEYNAKLKKNVEAWQSPKYKEAKQKAIEALESEQYKKVLNEGDFWILKNTTAGGKIAYSGLIISHNGCLKINDALPIEKRFKPSCVTLDKEARGGALVYTYICDEQGLYEVGEVNSANCSNAYPYAMALKRLIDRVVLKNSRLAYAGIMSDSEAEELAPVPEEIERREEKEAESSLVVLPDGVNARQALVDYCKEHDIDIINVARCHKLNNSSKDSEFLKALAELMAIYDKPETGEEPKEEKEAARNDYNG